MNEVILIDTFSVPSSSRAEFLERMTINRNLIKTLPGFVKDTAFEKVKGDGKHDFVTIAQWENEEVLKNAKQAVMDEYKKQGFNMPEMIERLRITMDRAIYRNIEH